MVKEMIRVRQAHTAFPMGDMRWALSEHESHVLAYWRTDNEHKLLIVNNLSDKALELGVDLLDDIGGVGAEDLLGGGRVGEIQGRKLHLRLEAYGYAWLALN